MSDYTRPNPDSCIVPAAVFDLSERTFLRFSGADRLRYLNGQLTQDLRRLTPSTPLPACITNAKGRLQAVVWVSEFPDFLIVDSDPAVHETLVPRLERYIVADDVLLEDVTGQFGLFHFTGADPIERPELQGLARTQVPRLGQAGWDVWVPAEKVFLFRESIKEELRSGEDWEQERVRLGIPQWGAELGEETLPPEAGLDRSHVDYHKGCYIGQEVISRLKSVGHVNRTLVALYAAPGSPCPEIGCELFAANGQAGVVVGKVTSAVLSESGEVFALGYVKRGVDALVFESGNGVRLERR